MMSIRILSPSKTCPGYGGDLSIRIGSSPCPAVKRPTENKHTPDGGNYHANMSM